MCGYCHSIPNGYFGLCFTRTYLCHSQLAHNTHSACLGSVRRGLSACVQHGIDCMRVAFGLLTYSLQNDIPASIRCQSLSAASSSDISVECPCRGWQQAGRMHSCVFIKGFSWIKLSDTCPRSCAAHTASSVKLFHCCQYLSSFKTLHVPFMFAFQGFFFF